MNNEFLPVSIKKFKDFSNLIKEYCENTFANDTIYAWRDEIFKFAKQYDLSYSTIEKRVRLLLPSIPRGVIKNFNNKIPSQLLNTLQLIFNDYKFSYSEYLIKSGTEKILDKELKMEVVNQKKILFADGNTIDIYYSNVEKEIGEFIESKLHYLMSPRADTLFRFGIFIKGYSYPFCYMSFSSTDRIYKINCIENIIGNELQLEKILNLARVYGFGNLPKNSISSLIAFSEKQLRENKYDYLTTAVNPFMGFTGKSIFSSNFHPFALCYVSYYYDSRGMYISRRSRNGGLCTYAKQKTPPNIILIKGLNKISGRIIRNNIKVFRITKKMYLEDEQTKKNIDRMKEKVNLESLRHDLEKVWNNLTKYHGTEKSPNDPISKGQCGVTSAYLATEFEQQGFETLFCGGDVIFPNDIPPIKNHCWLKIPIYNNDKEEIFLKNLIIDLTADQSGFSDAVICDTDENLRAKGICYNNSFEVIPKEIKFGSLDERFKMLDNSLKKLNKRQNEKR